MTELNSQNYVEAAPAAPAAPSVPQTSNDTPPVALTPADDGSDFYNTPQVAGTPVNSEQKTEAMPDAQPTEKPVSSNPAPQIPGLSLLNDNLKTNETQQDGPGANETSNKTIEDAMDVEHEQKQPEDTEMKGEMDTDPSGATNGAEQITGEVAATAQDGEQAGEDGEHPEWEIDSSPYESSSDSSDTDSSDSDDDEDYPILSPEEQARILMSGEMGSDDEGEGKGKSGIALKTANEVAEEAPAVPDVTVTPEMKIVLLGNVEAAVENTILIAANVTGEYQVLEAGSLLCLEDRRIAGVVSETLGRVENPLYAVKLPTVADVEERGLTRGTTVYYVLDHSTFVFTQPLKGLKGSDASNFHDEEVAEDEVEFSDDEQEAEYRKRLKQKRQERKGARNQDGGAKSRGPPGPSKLSQGELNYDDVPDDGYTPLARPKNLHEMMHQEAPVESDRQPGFSGGRGRGRGGHRGRGRGGRDHRDHHSHHDRQPYGQQNRQDTQPQHQYQQQQQQQYPSFNTPQQYPSYPQQSQPQQPYAQSGMPASPFNFQMPYQQPYQQPNPYQQMSPTPHINPLFLAALQQQQQYQQAQAAQAQPQPQPQQQQQQQPQQGQNQAMNFDQVKAQLDLLRQLSGNQWPPRS